MKRMKRMLDPRAGHYCQRSRGSESLKISTTLTPLIRRVESLAADPQKQWQLP